MCVCVRAHVRVGVWVCVPVGVGFPVGWGTPSVLVTEMGVHWGVEVLRPLVADH